MALAVHLDGARLMNASVASGVPAAEYGALADTVTLCFSKGLGCPLGAVLAGSRETMSKAWRGKFLFGGAMRQAGMVAAAALYALDHNVDRLAEDHARARRLAEGLAEAGLPVDPAAGETNFVGLEVEPLGLTTSRRRQSASRRRASSPGGSARGVRLATYLGVEDGDIERRASERDLARAGRRRSPRSLSGRRRGGTRAPRAVGAMRTCPSCVVDGRRAGGSPSSAVARREHAELHGAERERERVDRPRDDRRPRNEETATCALEARAISAASLMLPRRAMTTAPPCSAALPTIATMTAATKKSL